jgi:hypothetical protein
MSGISDSPTKRAAGMLRASRTHSGLGSAVLFEDTVAGPMCRGNVGIWNNVMLFLLIECRESKLKYLASNGC